MAQPTPFRSLGLALAVGLVASCAAGPTAGGTARPSARPNPATAASASPSPAPAPSGLSLPSQAPARLPLPLRLTPVLPASLVGADGAGLIAKDGGSLLGNDGGGLIANDGAALLANDGGSLIANDGGGLIANDGAGVVASGGGNVVASGGGNVVAGGAGNRRVLSAGHALAQAGLDESPVGLAAARMRRRLWEVTSLTYVLDQAMFLWAKTKPVPGRWGRITFKPRTLPHPEAGRLDPAFAKLLRDTLESLPDLACAVRLKPYQARGWELEVQRLPQAGARLRAGQLLGRFLVADDGSVSFRVRLKGVRPLIEEAGEQSGFIEGRIRQEGDRRTVEVDRPERISDAATTAQGGQLRVLLTMEPSQARTRLRITTQAGQPTELKTAQARRYRDPSRAIQVRRSVSSAQAISAGLAFWDRKAEGGASGENPWRYVDQGQGRADDGGAPFGLYLDAKGDVLREGVAVPAALLVLLPGKGLLEEADFLPAVPAVDEDPSALAPGFLPEAEIAEADDPASP